MKLNQLLVSLIVSICLVSSVSFSVLAHKMIIERPETGEVKVEFEDGTSAAGVEVILYNEADEVIWTGETDETGSLDYNSDTTPAKIVAEDNMGHRAVWPEEETGLLANWSFGQRVLLGLGILAVGTGLLKYKNN